MSDRPYQETIGRDSPPGVPEHRQEWRDELLANVVSDERHAQAILAKKRAEAEEAASKSTKAVNLHNLYDQISAGNVKELNVILKTDVGIASHKKACFQIKGIIAPTATIKLPIR